MTSVQQYMLGDNAAMKLGGLVSEIESKPGDTIDVEEFRALQEQLNVRSVLDTLPDGLSEDDFAGILKLALLTECATEAYSTEHRRSAAVCGDDVERLVRVRPPNRRGASLRVRLPVIVSEAAT